MTTFSSSFFPPYGEAINLEKVGGEYDEDYKSFDDNFDGPMFNKDDD